MKSNFYHSHIFIRVLIFTQIFLHWFCSSLLLTRMKLNSYFTDSIIRGNISDLESIPYLSYRLRFIGFFNFQFQCKILILIIEFSSKNSTPNFFIFEFISQKFCILCVRRLLSKRWLWLLITVSILNILTHSDRFSSDGPVSSSNTGFLRFELRYQRLFVLISFFSSLSFRQIHHFHIL